MQRGAGAARRAVSRAAAARLKNPDVATEVQQGVATSDFIPDQGANNSQWLRNFSAMSWTSSVTLQNINPRVRSSPCHFCLLCTYIYTHTYVFLVSSSSIATCSNWEGLHMAEYSQSVEFQCQLCSDYILMSHVPRFVLEHLPRSDFSTGSRSYHQLVALIISVLFLQLCQCSVFVFFESGYTYGKMQVKGSSSTKCNQPVIAYVFWSSLSLQLMMC